MGIQLRGHSGELRKGYKVAARLGAWAMDGSGRCEAQALETNDYWLDQPGSFDLWLWVGARAWVWKGVDVADRGEPFVVRAPGSPDIREA